MHCKKCMLIIFLWFYVWECRGFQDSSDPIVDISDTSAAQVGGQVRSRIEQQPASELGNGDSYEEESSLKELHRLKHVLEKEGIERTSLIGQTRLHFINFFHLYLPRSDLVNPQCQRDLSAIYTSILHLSELVKNGTLWPIKLVDSWGKFSDGVLMGNMREVGYFYECLDIHVSNGNKNNTTTTTFFPSTPFTMYSTPSSPPPSSLPPPSTPPFSSPLLQLLLRQYDHQYNEETDFPSAHYYDNETNFDGQYCMLNYAYKSPHNASSGVGQRGGGGLGMPSLSLTGGMPPDALAFIAYATCMPSSCTADELVASVNWELAESDVQVANINCQTKSDHLVLNTHEIVGIVILVLVCLLLAMATLCDQMLHFARWSQHRNGPLKYLLTFSLTQNLTRLFHLDTGKSDRVISSIHGIRFLSITWVILCHQYGFSLKLAQNIGELPEMTQPTLFQVISNGTFSVDTFFLMSGILVTLSLLSHLAQTGRFSPLVYYLHRILRLLPPIALTLALVATLTELLVSGPFSGYISTFLRFCRHNWWMDLTLTTNLIVPHLASMGPEYQGGTCLGHTWYVDVDTQLFIFMPLMLLPLYFYPKKGRVWLGMLTFISCLLPVIVVGVDHTWPTLLIRNDPSSSAEYTNKVYLMPWCRAGPYLVGAWYGYVIHTASHKPSLATLKPWQVACGWVLAVGAALSALFGMAPYNYINVPFNVPEVPRALAVLYGGFSRAVWAAAVGWVVLACHYTLYLTSVPVQMVLNLSTVRPPYFTHIAKVQETCGVIFLTFFAALFVSMASEAPVLRLERLLLRPDASSPVPTVREESASEESRLLHNPTTHDDDDDLDGVTAHGGQAEGSSTHHPQKYHQEDPQDGGNGVRYHRLSDGV